MSKENEFFNKRKLPCIFSMGPINLIFELEFEKNDLRNYSLDVNYNSKYYKFEEIDSLKGLHFLLNNELIWNKIKIKTENQTLNQLLSINQNSEEKCLIDYIGFGPLLFENEESFFNGIFNYVTKKYYLSINENFLDENFSSEFTIELKYQNNSKTIKFEKNKDNQDNANEIKDKNENNNEEDIENINELKESKKLIIKRKESVLNKIIPSLKKYELIYINYNEIEKIPGDFQLDDLYDLLTLFRNKGSTIFFNFYDPEIDYIKELPFENEENKILFDLIQIFFYDLNQVQNRKIYYQKKIKENNNKDKMVTKTFLIIDELQTFIANSLINDKFYKKNYLFDLIQEKEENEELNNQIKELIETNKAELYSLIISSFINIFAYNNINFYKFKIIDYAFNEGIKLIKNKIDFIRKKQESHYIEQNLNINFENKEDEIKEIEMEKVNAINNKEELNNIIYLIDTTKSMNKYNYIINSISDLNQALIDNYPKAKIGYVLYKDIEDTININGNINIIEPSSDSINIKLKDIIKFEGGDDFAEDWVSPINAISQLNLDLNGNIIIHICDAGAHGKRFSDYCNKNKFEKSLINALEKCSKKNIKILGLKINDYTKKSFLECQKIYTKFNGVYQIIDFTNNNPNNFDKNNFVIKIMENIEKVLNIENEINNEEKDNNDINENNVNDLNEDDFNFEGSIIKMRNLSSIKNYQGKKFTFLPQIDDKNINLQKNNSNIQGIRQGAIGDCYLISSILSMVSKFPLIFNYIFPNLLYNENSDIIEMYIYKNGIRELISFKNTYATKDENNLYFAKPYNNELYGICLEKGYAVAKAKNSIQSGYENIVGGSGYQVFELLLGTMSELYKSDHDYFKNRQTSYRYIEKDKLKEKIKKYIDWGGIITFGVFYHEKSAHEYSLQGYKIDSKTNEMFLEIINPHRSGGYINENIFVQSDYDKLTQEQKDEYDKRPTPKISEKDFINKESILSLKSYPETGFLLISFDTFCNWYGTIDICDPMFGSNDYTITFIPDGSDTYLIELNIDSIEKNKEKTKFKVSLKDMNSNKNKYNIELINDQNETIIQEDNSDIIYELLSKGKYFIKISSIKDKIIKNEIYIKIQCYEKLQLKINQKNNNIIIIENKNIFKDVYNQMNYMNKIFKKLQICNSYYKLDIFNQPAINDTDIYHRNKPYEKINGVTSFPNYYLDYQNTQSGFCLNLINKFGFDNENNIIFNQSGNDIICTTKHGKFKIKKDSYIMTGFDQEFKNYLKIKGFEGDEIDLKNMKDKLLNESNKDKEEVQSGCCIII